MATPPWKNYPCDRQLNPLALSFQDQPTSSPPSGTNLFSVLSDSPPPIYSTLKTSPPNRDHAIFTATSDVAGGAGLICRDTKTG